MFVSVCKYVCIYVIVCVVHVYVSVCVGGGMREREVGGGLGHLAFSKSISHICPFHVYYHILLGTYTRQVGIIVHL